MYIYGYGMSAGELFIANGIRDIAVVIGDVMEDAKDRCHTAKIASMADMQRKLAQKEQAIELESLPPAHIPGSKWEGFPGTEGKAAAPDHDCSMTESKARAFASGTQLGQSDSAADEPVKPVLQNANRGQY